MSQTSECVMATEKYQGLLSRSVQLTAQACAAWSSGEWSRGVDLILQAADLEDAAVREVGRHAA
ncbi:MAG TPA: hypothetical protein VNG13_14200 [Mycobacteriales bacterium]|nr:hypothetical protein [Mycobacteriales bacterium]